jgi:PAS domain S-box-containing protein
LDLAINGVSDGVWDWNLQTQALYLSPKLKEMAGYAESELPSHTETLAALMHPDDRHEAMQHISACAQGQTSAMHTEFRWRHKDGHWVWILSRGRLVRDAAGLPLRLVGSHTDISRLKQQETELSHQRRRLQDILDGTRAGTWEWNIQTDELVFNERCAEMLGYTLADWHPVSVQTWIQLVHPDDLLLSDQRLSLHLADKEAFYECELRMLHKQGHWAWVQDRGRVARRAADDTPLWMSGTHLDVTERKTQELALRESQHALQQAKDAAEAANLAKSRFLTTMSHEIRTPLNAILGLAQMLQMPQVTEAERTSYAQTVVRSGQTLLALLNDILDLSKVEAGKLELEAQPFVCGELLSDITTLFSEVAHEKGLVLRVLAPPPTTWSAWATRVGCARCWPTWWATPSSSPHEARSAWPCAWWSATRKPSRWSSRCATPGRASTSKHSSACSNPLSKPTAPPPGALGAPGLGFPSCSSSLT